MHRKIKLVLCLLVLALSTGFGAARAQFELPAACDVENRRPQSRFYQRARAPDDETDDGLWEHSTPSEQGIDADILAPGLAQLEASTSRQSLILMRRGQIIYERYYNGSHAADSNNIASISKSMLSALVGIALERGYVASADDRIADYLPHYFRDIGDAGKLSLTLRDLLTMRHGLAWIEGESERALNRSEDWIADILSLPMTQEPGAQFQYSTGVSHLLSAVLTEATGMSVCEFAQRYLFAPLGIEAEFWGIDPQGYFSGGHSVSMTAREIARFGQLFLNEGRWANEQIVPGWWVAASTSPQVEIGNNYAGYGYYWWLNRIANYDMFSALGAGGQFLHVIPGLELVMATTHRNFGNPRDYAEEAETYQFLWDYLIPAIADP